MSKELGLTEEIETLMCDVEELVTKHFGGITPQSVSFTFTGHYAPSVHVEFEQVTFKPEKNIKKR